MRRRYGQQEACRICGQDIEWGGKKHGWTDRGGNRSCVAYRGPDHEIVQPTGKHEPPISLMTKTEALVAYNALPTTSSPKDFIAGHGNWGLTEKEYEDATELANIIVRGAR